jgi:hypothetical protein
VLDIDKELALPVNVATFGWPEPGESIPADRLDEATLIEHYRYSQIRVDTQLADGDFDRANREYSFRR